MAKSIRSKSKKRMRTMKREGDTVFKQVERERLERLAAKSEESLQKSAENEMAIVEETVEASSAALVEENHEAKPEAIEVEGAKKGKKAFAKRKQIKRRKRGPQTTF